MPKVILATFPAGNFPQLASTDEDQSHRLGRSFLALMGSLRISDIEGSARSKSLPLLHAENYSLGRIALARLCIATSPIVAQCPRGSPFTPQLERAKADKRMQIRIVGQPSSFPTRFCARPP